MQYNKRTLIPELWGTHMVHGPFLQRLQGQEESEHLENFIFSHFPRVTSLLAKKLTAFCS